MDFAVETWAPEYGVAVDSGHLEPASSDVDVSVERPAGEWSAITPAPPEPRPGCVVFVDGVRRIDSRIWITDGPRMRPGVCASVAAGAVRCEAATAAVVGARVFRAVYATASSASGPIATRHGAYEFVPCPGDEPDDLYRGIHNRMTLLEMQVARDDDVDVVVFDGPLRGRADSNGVGFIKTQHVQYLPDREQLVLTTLQAGQRTPLFLIGGSGFTRWSWYLRLPGPVAHLSRAWRTSFVAGSAIAMCWNVPCGSRRAEHLPGAQRRVAEVAAAQAAMLTGLCTCVRRALRLAAPSVAARRHGSRR